MIKSYYQRKGRVMPNKSKKTKWTPPQTKAHSKNIEKAVEKHTKENKEEFFESITPEQIEKKLRRVNSPMIVSQSFGSATPGGTINYSVGIFNPDPVTRVFLFVHVFVGSGNVDSNVGTFLLNVDTRFPRLTGPSSSVGQSLASGASATLNFSIAVPATIERSLYLGNSCLMQINIFDVGTYLDRSCFRFSVI